MDGPSFVSQAAKTLYNMYSSVYALRLIITFHFFSRTVLSYSPLWNSAAAAIYDCKVVILLRHIWSRILLFFSAVLSWLSDAITSQRIELVLCLLCLQSRSRICCNGQAHAGHSPQFLTLKLRISLYLPPRRTSLPTHKTPPKFWICVQPPVHHHYYYYNRITASFPRQPW